MPAVEGLSHLTFIVRDLARMGAIIREVLGGQEVYSSGDDIHSLSQERFYLVGGLWIAVMQGERRAQRSYDHVAFKIGEDQFEPCRRAIERLGLEMLSPRSRIAGEARSIYFHDEDDHLFELHTGTLAERLDGYRRAMRS